MRCYGCHGLGAVCTNNRIDSKRLKLACGVVADACERIDNRERQHEDEAFGAGDQGRRQWAP